MRILAPGIERYDVGGGGSFLRNFEKAIRPFGFECTGYENLTHQSYDILFIAGASLCDRHIVEEAKKYGKPIVLRVDNILEDRRNRNGGMPKMLEYAEAADMVIYQTEWAKAFLSPVLKRDGIVISNGCDTEIFFPDRDKKPKELSDPHIFFYAKYSRGEGKNVNVVQQWWREHSLKRPQDILVLAGRFAEENFKVQHPFEFHNGEKFIFKGIARSPEQMAEWMRQADCAILPYFADACSNQILEAQACGLYVIYDKSGGTPEIIQPYMGEVIDFDIDADKDPLIRRIAESRMRFPEQEKFNVREIGLEKMGRQYQSIFKFLMTPDSEI